MDSGWREWIYIAACLLVPAAWGVVSAHIFERIDRRKKLADDAARRPPVDYSI